MKVPRTPSGTRFHGGTDAHKFFVADTEVTGSLGCDQRTATVQPGVLPLNLLNQTGLTDCPCNFLCSQI